jgi:hypothetical protein
MVLSPSAKLQAEINRIPATASHLRVLRISSTLYDDEKKFVLSVHMPKLEQLPLINVRLTKIELAPTLTPNLADIEFHNVPDDCQIQIILPKLRNFSM